MRLAQVIGCRGYSDLAAFDPGPIYEYACHGGNPIMSLILSGSRALERVTSK